jgi:hypothetical protein
VTTNNDGHGSIASYLSDSSNFKVTAVYRAERTADKALLKRRYYSKTFEPKDAMWLKQVYSSIPEYTMEQLQALVGHNFKLIK